MLRFIIETKWKETVSGAEGSGMHTIDHDFPELERELTKGGYGEGSYLVAELIGVEVLEKAAEGKV